MKPLSTMFEPFGAEWWKKLAGFVVNETKELGQKGEGANGDWPAYSTKRSLKSFQHTGFDTYAEAKAAGVFNRQSSRQVSPPNLELTGDMWRNLKVISSRQNGARVGFVTQGDKAQWAEDTGRPIFGDDGPAPPVQRQIDKAVQGIMRTQINETRGTVRFRVGK